jgi:hypothetical protein
MLDLTIPINLFEKSTLDLIFDIGREYADKEIKLMKDRLKLIFKEESTNYSSIVEKSVNLKYTDQDNENLYALDNMFFILKHCGYRAIYTRSVQLSLTIINNIKTILSEDILYIFDLKLSAVFSQPKTKNKLDPFEIKYAMSKEEPILGYVNTYGNTFLIQGLNCVDQCMNNIRIILDELNNEIMTYYFNSDSFDSTKVVLVEGESEIKEMDTVSYLKYWF